MADSKIVDLTEKATGAATDEFVINDVAGGNADKKLGMDGIRITESQITDLGSYITDVTGDNLSALADVTITSIASGEILKWNGSAWINNTLAEAGISATGHTHTESDITDLGSYITASSTDTLTNKTIDGDNNTITNLATGAEVTVAANSIDSDAYVDGSIDDAHLSTTDDAMLAIIPFVIDGGGSAITTGVKGYIPIGFNCTIERVEMLADQSGSIVVDIWKDTYANYPPVDADSITASAVPTISSGTKDEDETLTGWTTAITKGDILGFNVDSATTVERVTIALRVRKT